jgi:hypothetical protein
MPAAATKSDREGATKSQSMCAQPTLTHRHPSPSRDREGAVSHRGVKRNA